MARLIFFYVCQVIIFSNTLTANPSFYALSSLRFYFESGEGADSPSFNKSEIQELFEMAQKDTKVGFLVKEAYNCYTKEASTYRKKAQKIIKEAWQHLDDAFFQDKIKSPFLYSCSTENERFNYIDNKWKKRAKDHLLRKDHPMFSSMEALFSRSRATESDTSLQEAGFSVFFVAHNSMIRVARHPSLPDYLCKIAIDTETRKKKGRPAWEWLIDRCRGALKIRKLIIKEKMQHFSVPDKWLYPLPKKPEPHLAPGEIAQPFVLLVTDMKITSLEDTLLAWKTKITPSHLKELYSIFSHGLSSLYLAGNIPYCTNGKFACVDTEFPYKRKLDFNKITPFLSKNMREVWNRLIKSGGKKI